MGVMLSSAMDSQHHHPSLHIEATKKSIVQEVRPTDLLLLVTIVPYLKTPITI